MRATRVGLLGAGRWGKNILRDLVLLGCEVAVVDPSEQARGDATSGGAVSTATEIRHLPEVDGIVVATPASDHSTAASAALQRGVPVFVEKPLAPDPDTAERMVKDGGDLLYAMHKWRYHPGVEELARLARSAELGEVAGLRSTRVGWGQHQDDVDTVWNLAPHDVSIGLEVLGRINLPTWARAETVDGAMMGINAGFGTSPWHILEVSSRTPVRRREIVLRAEGGVALLNIDLDDRISIARGDGGSPAPDIEERRVSAEMPLLRELRAIVGFLRGGAPPKSTGADGAAVVSAVARIRELSGPQ